MLDKACVSSSSVKKTFFTPCMVMSVPFAGVMCIASIQIFLAQPHAVIRIPLGHVRKNDFISGLQPVEDLDGVDRTLTQFDVDAHSFRTIVYKFEQADGAPGLAIYRPTDVEDILEIFDFDGAVDAEVWAGTVRERAGDGDVHSDGAVLHGWFGARDLTGDDSIARVDGSFLADGNILGLRFGDFDFCLQLFGVGDAREICSGGDMLAHFHGDELKDAMNAGANMQGVQFRAAQSVESALLLDAGLLGEEARSRGICGIFGAFFLELDANGQLLGANFGQPCGHVRAEAVGAKFLVHIVLNLGLFELAADRCGRGLLVQKLAVELSFQILVIRLGRFELILGVQCVALQRGIAQFEDDGIGIDDGAGAKHDALHARIGLRGNPANVLRHQSAQAVHIPKHGSTLDFVGPDGRTIHGRGGGAQVGNADGYTAGKEHGEDGIHDSSNLFGARIVGPLYVHSDSSSYSYLKATIGSMRVARRAGM